MVGVSRFAKLGVVVVAVAVVIGAATYWFVLRSDSKAKAAITKTAVTKVGPLDGTWSAFAGIGTDDASTTWVGYRMGETLAGFHRTDVGRSTAVTGIVRIEGNTVSSISVVADQSKLTTDNGLRDTSVRNVLEVTKHRDATFVSTAPVVLPARPTAGALISTAVTGDLTLHGVTRHVTVSLQARWDGRHIEVIGEFPITMADYSIVIPEVPGLVKADDHGSMELQLFLQPQP